MIETCRLKNVIIFVQTILSFVLSRKIIKLILYFTCAFVSNHIIHNYFYLLLLQKQIKTKTFWHTNNIKMKNSEF